MGHLGEPKYLSYCFEEAYVAKTLKKMKKNGLAVIDSDGIRASTVHTAVDRGVMVYDYLNVGALERERSFYAKFKHLRLAEYEGWPGEFWIDPTSNEWKQHLYDAAREKKTKGAIGLYVDNGDILWMAKSGFREENSRMLRSAPSAMAVYNALLDIFTTLTFDLGLICMPNGADLLVRQMFADGYGKSLIKTINQEGCIFEDFKKQSKSEMDYRTAYMLWALRHGLYVRGIEYAKSSSDISKAKKYYEKHGFQGLYISSHTDLRGD